MPKAEEIAHWKAHYANYSDEQLIAEKHQWVENSEMHIAAVQILHERQKAKEAANHAQLLTEIKRPHWSVTPGFVVGVIAMVAACIAAYQLEELKLQREELRLQREAMELTRIELARSAEALEANRRAAQMQTKFLALTTMQQIYQLRLNVVEDRSSEKLYQIARQIEKQVDQLGKDEA